MPGRRRLRVTRKWVWPALIGALVIIVLAAGAAAAIETATVHSYWRGLWWSISLMTTVGYIGEPPETGAGVILSVFLMVVGFLLLAMISASMAALFVRQEERPREEQEGAAEGAMLASLMRLEARLTSLEAQIAKRSGHESSPLPGPRDQAARQVGTSSEEL